MVRRAVVVGVVAALTLLGTGCSDDPATDDVPVEAQPYVEALSTALARDGAGGVELDSAQAACVAPRWVDVLDPRRLDDAGVDPVDLDGEGGLAERVEGVELTDADVDRLLDAVGDCDIDLHGAFLDGLTAGATPSDDDRACLDDAVSPDLARRAVALGVTDGQEAADGDPQLMTELFEALSACPGAIELGT